MEGFILFTIRYAVRLSGGFSIDSFQYFDLPPDSISQELLISELSEKPSEELEKLKQFLIYVPLRARFNNDIDKRIFKVNIDQEITMIEMEEYLDSLGDDLEDFLERAKI